MAMSKVDLDKVKKGMGNIVPPKVLEEQRRSEAAYAQVYTKVYNKVNQTQSPRDSEDEARRRSMKLCASLCEETMGKERHHDKLMAVSMMDAYSLLSALEKSGEKDEMLNMATVCFITSKLGAGPLDKFQEEFARLKDEEGMHTFEMQDLRAMEKTVFATFFNPRLDKELQTAISKHNPPDQAVQMPSWSVFAWLQAYCARVNHATSNHLQKDTSWALKYCQEKSWALRHSHTTYDPELLPETMASGLPVFSLVCAKLLNLENWRPDDMNVDEWQTLYFAASGEKKVPVAKFPNAVQVLTDFIFMAVDLDKESPADVMKLKNCVRKTAEALRIAADSGHS